MLPDLSSRANFFVCVRQIARDELELIRILSRMMLRFQCLKCFVVNFGETRDELVKMCCKCAETSLKISLRKKYVRFHQQVIAAEDPMMIEVQSTQFQ